MDKYQGFTLVWIVNGVIKQHLTYGSAAICNYTKKQALASGNYPIGLLQVRSIKGLSNGPKVLTNKLKQL